MKHLHTITMSHTLFLSLALLSLLSLHSHAQNPSAPAPAAAGPINITEILDAGRQFTTFIRFLNDNGIAMQINTSTEGMTVFAPTDNAFDNLPAGALNKLSDRQQVQLILYHVLPKYYDLPSLLTVSNPVRTLLSGQDHGVYGLNFTGQGTQVNVSTGIVDTLINNPLTQKRSLALINNPLTQKRSLAVYQVDKVLLPEEFYEAKPPAASPYPKKTKGGADATSSPKSGKSEAAADEKSGSGRVNVGYGLVLGIGLLCMGGIFGG